MQNNKKIRKFAFPYNGDDPEVYLKIIDQYREHIDSFFMSLPNTNSYLSSYITSRRGGNYDEMCGEMLNASNQCGIRRFVTLNACYDLLSTHELERYLDQVAEKIVLYNVDGIISSDFFVAKALRQLFPDLLIDTSCNTMQYDVGTALTWNREIGIHAFNTPRSSVRNLELLKKFKDHGLTTKVLINEGCVMGCPYEINHYIATGCQKTDQRYRCIRSDRRNYFKKCIAMPRWLDVLDDYVDIYKLSGRFFTTETNLRQLELFLEGGECDYSLLYPVYLKDSKYNGTPIMTSDIPDHLLYCRGENCDQCTVCSSLVKKFFNE